MQGFLCLALFSALAGAGCGPATPPGWRAGPEQGGAVEPAAEPGYESQSGPDRDEARTAPDQPGDDSPVQDGPAAQPAAGNAEPTGRLQGMLAAHNRYRQKHCAPPLSWSEELARLAQDWADQLHKQGCAFEHSPDNRHGENLAYYAPAGAADADKVVSGWYDEIAKYDFRKPGFSFETGHFTQVVWKRTREVGCGMTTCNNAAIWVCNYSPPGNFRRQYKDNVLPASCSRR